MKPAPFKYHAPRTVGEVLDHLAEYGNDAKVLAGGQSLIPTMNFRLAQPAVLIDLNRIAELFYIRSEKSGLRIGAMTRKREAELSSVVAEKAPLVYEAMPYIGHVQVRNRGTMGGSIAHADPASELPAVMVALEARFLARNKKRERWIRADEFFKSSFATALQADELLVELEVPPLPRRTGCSFQEVSRRRGDYALVGVGAVITVDKRGKCEKARLVFLSVGDRPIEARHAETLLVGHTIEAVEDAAKTATTKDIEPGSDIHASSEYRRKLAEILAARALKQAFARAQDKGM